MTEVQIYAPLGSSGADISSGGGFRYSLWRAWGNGLWEGPGHPYRVLFVMLNPSDANAYEDDPTIRKCIGFAKRWGYGGLTVVNLMPLVSSNPDVLKSFHLHDSEDQRNDQAIAAALASHPVRIAAWGARAVKLFPERVRRMRRLLGPVALCLRKTKTGEPEHPLYVPYETKPIPLEAT